MEKCLITKLQGGVYNDSLKKLNTVNVGILISNTNVFTSNNFVALDANELLKIKIIDNGKEFISATSPSEIVDSKTALVYGVYNHNVTLNESGLTHFEVSSIYNIKNIKQRIFSGTTFNLEDWEYFQGENLYLNDLSISTCGNTVVGDIYYISKSPNLKNVKIRTESGLTGNIQSLGVLTHLETIDISSTYANRDNIQGDWNDFVQMQRELGRTECTGLTIQRGMGYVGGTINGHKHYSINYNENSAVLTWDSSKMGFWDKADYTPSVSPKRVYLIGYSSSEISELEGQGWTPVICD